MKINNMQLVMLLNSYCQVVLDEKTDKAFYKLIKKTKAITQKVIDAEAKKKISFGGTSLNVGNNLIREDAQLVIKFVGKIESKYFSKQPMSYDVLTVYCILMLMTERFDKNFKSLCKTDDLLKLITIWERKYPDIMNRTHRFFSELI